MRYFIRPWIAVKLQTEIYRNEIITEYLTNYLCFLALSVEIFSILYLYGVVKNIALLLFFDTAVLLGVLVVGMIKMDLRKRE